MTSTFNRLVPSLQLASAVLRCRESDKFFRTIFSGKSSKTGIRDGHGKETSVLAFLGQYDTITDSERRQVQKGLERLADVVCIEFSQDLSDTLLGDCKACFDSLRCLFLGLGSKIRIDAAAYSSLDPNVTLNLAPASLRPRQFQLDRSFSMSWRTRRVSIGAASATFSSRTAPPIRLGRSTSHGSSGQLSSVASARTLYTGCSGRVSSI